MDGEVFVCEDLLHDLVHLVCSVMHLETIEERILAFFFILLHQVLKSVLIHCAVLVVIFL
jgi:hypothetical protein